MDLKRAVIDLMPAPLVRTFAAPYIAGKGVSSGVAKADDLHKRLGLYSTLDLLGEEVFLREDVEATVQVYFRMIEALKDRPYASISLKPTQIGINQTLSYCQDNLRRITAAAAAHGMRITLDMEDRTLTDASLVMYKAVRSEFDNIGIVLQSRLFRTPDDIKSLHARPCRVRICIGIYKERAEVALQDKPDMKERLFEQVQLLLDHGHYPEIATHDEPLVRRCIEHLDKRGVAKDAYEFQMLLGVPRGELQGEIVKRGQIMRLYVPFAEDWKYATRYLKRRLAANPAMAFMVMKNLSGR
ncbi:MAG: proline dehydrogenase family protein [Vicinamibacteria bacterium]|nr:proline dehydrogenase family protein [Vicinamibacteria bacterium]